LYVGSTVGLILYFGMHGSMNNFLSFSYHCSLFFILLSLLVKSFLTESCSKFSIIIAMNKFSKINWPTIRIIEKNIVEPIGSVALE
jgi:hypothetical protein